MDSFEAGKTDGLQSRMATFYCMSVNVESDNSLIWLGQSQRNFQLHVIDTGSSILRDIHALHHILQVLPAHPKLGRGS